jgi:hypothetical protein
MDVITAIFGECKGLATDGDASSRGVLRGADFYPHIGPADFWPAFSFRLYGRDTTGRDAEPGNCRRVAGHPDLDGVAGRCAHTSRAGMGLRPVAVAGNRSWLESKGKCIKSASSTTGRRPPPSSQERMCSRRRGKNLTPWTCKTCNRPFLNTTGK